MPTFLYWPQAKGDYGEDFNGDDEFMPKMGCLNKTAWQNAVEEVADRILWDRDFEMEDDFGAMGGSGFAEGLMQMMHIDQNYYQPIQERARPGARNRLHVLCRRLSD